MANVSVSSISVPAVLGAMNLLAGVAHASMSDVSPVNDRQTEGQTGLAVAALNASSLRSVEASWLKVPEICKAKNFNADATVVEISEARQEVQAIYQIFGRV